MCKLQYCTIKYGQTMTTDRNQPIQLQITRTKQTMNKVHSLSYITLTLLKVNKHRTKVTYFLTIFSKFCDKRRLAMHLE